MNIAIDLGKWNSYVVMEDNDEIVKEGYVQTTKEDLLHFFGNVKNPKIIVESSSTSNWIANMFEGYDIILAHPAKVRLIAEAVKKTDKIDAHTILDLYKKNYMPESYLPSPAVRETRDLCRDRSLLVKNRTAIKNKIKYHAFCIDIRFKGYGKKNIQMLANVPKLSLLVRHLREQNAIIKEYDNKIAEASMHISEDKVIRYAKLLDTIPGVGSVGALSIASEIGDINRFTDEFKLFSHAGLVPRTYQSGNRDYKGHITKGNAFLKTMLLQCVQIHIRFKPDSPISHAYHRIKIRAGKKKAKVAAAKRLLRVIYWMLKRDEEYHDR